MVGGHECITLAQSNAWIHRVLKPKDHEAQDTAAVVKALLVELREKVVGLAPATDSSSQDDEESPESPADAGPGKQALFSETENEDEAPPAKEPPKKRQRHCASAKKKIGVRAVGFVDVPLDGHRVYLGVKSGPGLVLRIDGGGGDGTDSVKVILDHLKRRYEDLLNVGEPSLQAAKARRKQANAELTKSDENRVTFCFRRHAWKVAYRDKAGDLHTPTKGWEVPRVDHCNMPLDPIVYQAAKSKMLEKARAAWNDLDKSDKARY